MNIINGTNPTVSTLNKICNGFEMSLMDFFQDECFEFCEED